MHRRAIIRNRLLNLTSPLWGWVPARTSRAVAELLLAGWLVVMVTTAAAASVAVQDTSSPRNIVFILTDDQRFDALSLINDYFETPHLDTLAEGGVIFENAFVTTSLCSPSRASILSYAPARHHSQPTSQPDVAALGMGASAHTELLLAGWPPGARQQHADAD